MYDDQQKIVDANDENDVKGTTEHSQHHMTDDNINSLHTASTSEMPA